MLRRIAQNSKETLTRTLYVGETATDLDSGNLVVTVTDTAGDTVSTGNATGAGSGVYTYTLTPTDTASLGPLSASWVGTLDGYEQTWTDEYEVVGSHVVSLNYLRGFEPLDDATRFPLATLTYLRDLATIALEHECCRSFTRRYKVDEFIGTGRPFAALEPFVSSVDSVSIAGTALDADALAYFQPHPTGIIERRGGVFTNGAVTEVGYTYGEAAPDPRVARAIGLLAADMGHRSELGDSGSAIPDRARGFTGEGSSWQFVTAGVGAAAFDLPEVNAVVEAYRV